MRKRFISTLGLGLLLGGRLWAQSGYTDQAALTKRLQQLNAQYKNLTSLQSIGKTSTGKDLWVLSVGQGDRGKKPAVVIVANLEGWHLAATELTLQTAEKLLSGASSDSVARLLTSKTFYFLPNLNPDAAAQYFAKLKYERSSTARPVDEDRDGRVDEDGPEDLNGDGLITQIRIEDPTGTYRVAKGDPRVLVKADAAKGEQGQYLVYTEGIDNDKDGAFNEDGLGGIHLNKNFTFEYEPFKPGSGDYPVSELENRALIDWLYENKNVYAILTFGPANNLTEAYKFDPMKANQRVVKGWQAKDVAVNEYVSKLYTATGLKDAPSLPSTKGDFPSWAYYHFGKLSFSTPGWWMPKDTARAGSPRPAGATPVPGGRPGMGAGRGAAASPALGSEEDVELLKWAKANNIEAFVEWKEIKHPDFPGKKVEVGGLVPFVKWNPPVAMLTPAAEKHASFLLSVAKAMPEVEIVNVQTETLSPGLNRITVDVHNKGLLPTHSELGNRVKYEDRLKIVATPAKNQKLVSGRTHQLVRTAIAGNGVEQLTWLVSGTGTFTIEASSAPAGSSKVTVNLK
ncbi:M14 family metallopeptidase [Siphonobacter curvatus]|uniref:Peptidase M14 n=1 Tax=Siphonobacter curvatus TaxID=2094562 RepID=A0A2S7IQN3_9BACT|nr:M14 family metallopeptidase [Siphonobacter curvatus]PQA59976.1 peptidase M14 [Siphonobacter curvatus]